MKKMNNQSELTLIDFITECVPFDLSIVCDEHL